jgi:hypothetical protein
MSGGPHRIRADRLRSLPRVVPCVQRSPAVSRTTQGVRWNAPEGDGGGTRPCRRRDPTMPGIWTPHGSPAGSPRVAGSKGHAPKDDGVRGVVGAGAGAAAMTRRWCWRRYLSPVRGARDVHVKASAGVCVRGGVIGSGLARHGVDTDGTAALRPAPWVAADSTAVAGLVRAWERRLVAKRTLAGQEGGAPSSAFACARQPVTARPWRAQAARWASWRSGAREGPKAQPHLQGYGARVLGCTPARGRRGSHRRTHERERTGTARRRPRRGGSLRLEGLG